VLAQSKQFISTYLARSSALLQPAEPERTNGASASAVAATAKPQAAASSSSTEAVKGGN
jgi:hypothetical protein